MTRLEQLQKFLDQDPNDSFTRYLVALEYASAKNYNEASSRLESLKIDDPNYVPTYYQLADFYRNLNDQKKAVQTYNEGITIARKAGDMHAASELELALSEVEEA